MVRTLLLFVAACTVEHPSPSLPEQACDGDRLVVGAAVLEDCGATGRRCDAEGGCLGCIAGSTRCDGASVERCEGGEWIATATCAEPSICSEGACEDACAVAERERSYLGCRYDAVSTLNSLLADGFDFGIVLGNPGSTAAEVRIRKGGVEVARRTIAPRSADHVALPRIEAISDASEESVVVANGAYRIESDRPIAAYQYNPLEFRRSPDCVFTGTTVDRGCFSFTNDASLLLPLAALGTEHLLAGRTSESAAGSAFVAIVAHEATRVHVLSLASLAGSSSNLPLPARPASVPFDVDLAAGDVLQLVTHEGSLSGTEITSDRPVLVIAGNDCANVPVSFGACDHLEEVMLPLDSWGTTVIAAAPRAIAEEPSVIDVISGSDGNRITISGLPRAITLDRGENFEMVTTDDLMVQADGPILVSQYLVGAQYFARDPSGALGDPSMGLAPFVEQFRTAYGFTVPETYSENFAAIVGPMRGEVLLDGEPIDSWEPIAGSDYRVARVPIASGAHTLDAAEGAGLTLYGLAPYTSYLLPGGLDVERLR
jgi:hypothetical protein